MASALKVDIRRVTVATTWRLWDIVKVLSDQLKDSITIREIC